MFRVIYFVSTTEKTARFYEKAFGARRMKPPAAQDYPPEDWIQVKTGSVQIGFHRLGFLKANRKKPENPFKLVFKVADVAKKRKELVRMGVSMTRVWALEPRGEICDGWDPEGNRFQIADR
jgi:predicted enzyme related to lactoylglutathione lyase